MTDGSNAPDSGTPAQRPPGWQPPAETVPTWNPSTAYPPPTPVAPFGQPQPGYPSPAYPQQPPPYGQQPYQPLHQARPVYKPGTIPLRPLGVGDMFSGAVETIRRNPKATLGLAAVVLTAFMLIPVLGTLAWGAAQGFGSKVTDSGSSDLRPEDVGLLVTTLGGTLLSSLATIVLTGMIVHVVEHAARGQKLSAGEAWTLTKPRVWRLLGLSALTFLVPLVIIWIPVTVVVVLAFLSSDTLGIVALVLGCLAGLVVMVFLYIRLFQLAAPNVVLEQRNCFAAMRRSWELSRGQFWRLFGITILTLLVTSIGSQFLALPFGVVSGISAAVWPDTLIGILVGLLAQNVAVVVSGALTTPFSAGVAALQYLDQRIRKEGYDAQLIAGIALPVQG